MTQKIFQKATIAIQHQDFDQVPRLLQEFLLNPLDFPEAHELMGISLMLQKDYENAKIYLQNAQIQKPKDARYNSNLGEALRKLDELDKAEQFLKEALKQQESYIPAQFNLACTFLSSKKYKQAETLLKKILSNQPNNAHYLTAYADLLRKVGKTKKSIKYYKKAIKVNSQFANAYSNLALSLLSIGKIDNALENSKKALKLDPNNGFSYLNYGRCLSHLEQYDEAMNAYADALEIIPESAQLLTEIGNNWLLANDLIQAEYWYMQALEKNENYTDALCGLADTHREGGLLDEALEEINTVIDKQPDSIKALQVRGKINLDNGFIQECLKDYQRLIELKPNQASIYTAYGHALENAGELIKAEKQYRLALAKNPNCIGAYNGLATTQKGSLPIEDAQKMLELVDYKEYRDGAKASLHSGLGYFFDGTKQYNKAAKHFDTANHHHWIAKSNKGWTYDPDTYRKRVDKIIETFDEAYFTQLKASGLGHPSELPAFIVGMPRSGTTLTEQILNSHPQVLGIGECSFISESFTDLPLITKHPQYSSFDLLSSLKKNNIEDIANWHLGKLNQLLIKHKRKNILKVVDKMPDNYSLIGWILTLFPNAKIIHTKRDVRDVAVSCWMTQFGKIRWAFDHNHIAERIIQYDRLMKHWRKVIPDRFIETDYENMVNNQAYHSELLINYLDLPWDERCLSFYKQETVVRTASVTQVRQPIYTKSLKRWKRYEKPLEKLFKELEKAQVEFFN